jgi:hypothetical protein
MRLALLLTLLAATLGLAAPAAQAQPEAVPTTVVVRAVSHDAKVIQDPVGGARITIRDAGTGEVLAEGTQTGDSGDTDRIMRQPRARGADVYDSDGAGRFEAVLDLHAPTRVEITAEGPLDFPDAMQATSKTLWLVPGEDVTGDGVVLPLHGFIVEILTPTSPVTAPAPGDTLGVRARVRMLCGCPTRPGGLWNAERYTIEAHLVRGGEVVSTVPLTYTGTTSEYAAALVLPTGGPFDAVRVTASDAGRVNFGVQHLPLVAPEGR